MSEHVDPIRRTSGGFGPRITAVERRLERLGTTDPSPSLRRRVLGAVDDVLLAPRQTVSSSWDDAVPGRVWAVAAALGMCLTVAVLTATSASRRVEPLTLAERMRIAGGAEDELPMLAVSPPAVAGESPRIRTATTSTVFPALRVIDARRLFEENL